MTETEGATKLCESCKGTGREDDRPALSRRLRGGQLPCAGSEVLDVQGHRARAAPMIEAYLFEGYGALRRLRG